MQRKYTTTDILMIVVVERDESLKITNGDLRKMKTFLEKSQNIVVVEIRKSL